MRKSIPFDLNDMVKLVYAGKSLPQPDRVRFYTPSIRGFVNVLKEFRKVLDANQRVLNPGFVPSQRALELYVLAFLRSFMLTCHYDVYKNANVCPVSFTPSKVKYVLEQPMPKLLLDAMRELVRPQVVPGGLMIFPDPGSFVYPIAVDPAYIIRNSVRLGNPDLTLTRFGIYWYPPLGHAFRAAWMTGTEDGNYALKTVSDTKRENLAPVKFAAVCHVVKKAADLLKAKPLDGKKKEKKELDDDSDDVSPPSSSSSSSSSFSVSSVSSKLGTTDIDLNVGLKEESVRYKEPGVEEDWNKTIDVGLQGKGRGFILKSVIPLEPQPEIGRTYFVHDFDSVKDAVRDFATRMLRPVELYFAEDIISDRKQESIDITPASIAFLGVDVWRGSLPYTVWQFQSQILDFLEGDRSLYLDAFYVSRWSASLQENLQQWHFPSLNAQGFEPAKTLPISSGPTKRRQRRRGQGKQPNSKPHRSGTAPQAPKPSSSTSVIAPEPAKDK